MSQRLRAKTSSESAWSVTSIALKISLCPGLHHPMSGLWAKGEKPWNAFPFKLWALPPRSIYICSR